MNTRFIFLSPDGSEGGSAASGGGGAAAAGAAPAGGESGGGSAAAAYQVPAGYRQVSDADWTARDTAFQRASQLGLTDDKGFKELSALMETVKGRNMTPAMLAQLLTGQKDEPKKGESQQLSADDIEARIMAKMRSESALDDWNRRHGESDKWAAAKAKELLGGQDDEVMSPILTAFVKNQLAEARYKAGVPADHPLHGKVSGLYDDSLFENTGKSLADLSTKLAGWKLKAIGEAANKGGKTPPTAGNNATANKKSEGEEKPYAKWSDEEKIAYVERQMAGKG